MNPTVSMRGSKAALLLTCMALVGCTASSDPDAADSAIRANATAPGFDGADYASEAQKVAHGERLAALFYCNGCHLEDYSGTDFGEMFPVVDGLWASNISVTMPQMTDAVLERLLREGVHPSREIYVMPSKQTQFLSERDMDALIAFLRTVEPTGEPTPVPPAGFEAAVTARLPADYWRTGEDGRVLGYHNAAEEVAYFRENTVPDLGAEHGRGRMVVQSICTACHGAAMDGVGEPAGDIQSAPDYDDAAFVRLLREGIDRQGQPIEVPYGLTHIPPGMTDAEVSAAISYTRALARERASAK